MTELTVPVDLDGKVIELNIYADSNNDDTLIKIEDSFAAEHSESPYQLLEGYDYEYKFVDPGFQLREIPRVITRSKANSNAGRITPNIYVGTLVVEVEDNTGTLVSSFSLEVRSVKASYREDYRFMLQEITEKCADLIMQMNSPVIQNFSPDFSRDSLTLYQRFAFLRSIIETSEFRDAIHRITTAPVTTWSDIEECRDIRKLGKLNSGFIKQFATAVNRIVTPGGRYTSVPARVYLKTKHDIVDTSENRFVKYALNSFFKLCSDIRVRLSRTSRAYHEVLELEASLENMLSHSLFREVSSLKRLSFNNPVLQRKEGYREVFRVWLLADLAAKLVWSGGEDVYHAGKRDVAVLYEYWLFFTLLDVFKDIFKIEPKSIENLIESTENGLGLKLKSGECTALKGVYNTGNRALNVEFYFNRTYSGAKEYPLAGSYSKSMRPDYSLSIWPVGFTMIEAEEQELIVHIHFDAKYKVSNLFAIIGSQDENLDEEKIEQKKGNYQRGDLLKMHAYKDAIRRTAGAYVLYPGDGKPYTEMGFHEVLPGLGAFPIRPASLNNGIIEFKNFILDVVRHFENRNSRRERLSYGTFNVYKDKPKGLLKDALPEKYNSIRQLAPDDTSVLIGFCKGKAHREWVENRGLYNVRVNDVIGSLRLGPKEAGADFLLLYSSKNQITKDIFRVKKKGPKIFSRDMMIKSGYPNPSLKDFYLVYEIQKVSSSEFFDLEWDLGKLAGFNAGGAPFAVSLTELMEAKAG